MRARGMYACMCKYMRCHSPASKPRFRSSPLCLSSTSFGNFARMNSQRPWFTRVSVLVAVRNHEPTLSLQRGQLKLLCSNVPFRQRKQRLCVHGSVTGSIRMLRQTGHIRSRSRTFALGRDNDKSNSFDERFRYVAIFPCSYYATINDCTALHCHHHEALCDGDSNEIPSFSLYMRNAQTRQTTGTVGLMGSALHI